MNFDSEIVFNMPEALYHARTDELSSTQIKWFDRSAKHFKAGIDGKFDGESPAFRFGRAVHGLALEPDQFFSDNAVIDASTRTTKKYKELAATEKRPIYLQHEIDAATEVAVAVRSDPEVVREDLFENAHFETSFFWLEGGRKARARTDIWLPARDTVCDLKTTDDASPKAFTRDLIRYGYDISAAWYRRALEMNGHNLRRWLWIVVEKKPPYAVQIYEADSAWMDWGDAKIDRVLRNLAHCEATGKWPSYAQGVYKLAMPAWAGID